MKTLLSILCVIVLASVVLAEKPVQTVDATANRIDCAIGDIVYYWDFRDGDQGFTTALCDDQGVPAWEYGYWPPGDLFCWGTILLGDYESDSGESLISPTFLVDGSTYLVEVHHGYNIESGYDGGNLAINGTVVAPLEGYPEDEISSSESYYAWCVDGEPGFSGSLPDVVYSCFDLSAFMGEEVQLSFDFGSDSSVTNPGWVLFNITIGSDVVATDSKTWSALKVMYR